MNFLLNSVREGRKFLTIILSKNSSFMKLFEKNKVNSYAKLILSTITDAQLGGRVLQRISLFAKVNFKEFFIKI